MTNTADPMTASSATSAGSHHTPVGRIRQSTQQAILGAKRTPQWDHGLTPAKLAQRPRMSSQNNFRRQTVDSRQRQDLDNHITGHYGEDQFQGEGDFIDSAHWAFIMNQPMREVYSYNRAEDGPECEVITRVLASHTQEELADEGLESIFRWFDRWFDTNV